MPKGATSHDVYDQPEAAIDVLARTTGLDPRAARSGLKALVEAGYVLRSARRWRCHIRTARTRHGAAIAMVPEWPRRTKIRLGAKPDQRGPLQAASPHLHLNPETPMPKDNLIERLRELLAEAERVDPLPWQKGEQPFLDVESGLGQTATFEYAETRALVVEAVNALPDLLDALTRKQALIEEMVEGLRQSLQKPLRVIVDCKGWENWAIALRAPFGRASPRAPTGLGRSGVPHYRKERTMDARANARKRIRTR
jgi:hypothetical protein